MEDTKNIKIELDYSDKDGNRSKKEMSVKVNYNEIMYGQGYSWCISQSNLNYYSTYRIQHKEGKKKYVEHLKESKKIQKHIKNIEKEKTEEAISILKSKNND